MQLTRTLLITCLLTCCFFATLLAQDRIITGRITNVAGVGIAGATVQGKVSNVSLASNGTGNFSITIPASENALAISSVGFLSKTVDITGKSSVDIFLTDDPKSIFN